MKCKSCGWHIDAYPCPYCDAMGPAMRRGLWSRPAFWFAVILTAAAFGVVVPLVYNYYWRRTREHSIKLALETHAPRRLAEGLVSEYELTGADTTETNRCAKAILESQPEGMGMHLRHLIDERWEARYLVYEILGVLGSLDDAVYLQTVFDSSPPERESCVRAVITITATRPAFLARDTCVCAFVSRALADPEHQRCALETMATYPQPEFVRFVEALVENRQLRFHAEAVRALLRVGSRHALRVRDAIFDAADTGQQLSIALAAASRNTRVGIRWLSRVWADSASTNTQKSEAGAELSKLEERMGLDAFRIEYESEDFKVRIRAVHGAGELSEIGRVNFLSDALRDPSTDVRLTALNALGKRYHPRAVRILISILENLPEKSRRKFRTQEGILGRIVMNALGDMGAHEAVPALAKFLKPEVPLTKYARPVLAKITLETKINTPQQYTEWYEKNRDKTRLQYLVEKLSDPSARVRDCAYRMLVALTGQKIIFCPYAQEKDRARQVKDWEEWLFGQGLGTPETSR